MAKKIPKPISRAKYWAVLILLCLLYGAVTTLLKMAGISLGFFDVVILFLPISLWSYYYKSGQFKRISKITAQNAREEMGEEDK